MARQVWSPHLEGQGCTTGVPSLCPSCLPGKVLGCRGPSTRPACPDIGAHQVQSWWPNQKLFPAPSPHFQVLLPPCTEAENTRYTRQQPLLELGLGSASILASRREGRPWELLGVTVVPSRQREKCVTDIFSHSPVLCDAARGLDGWSCGSLAGTTRKDIDHCREAHPEPEITESPNQPWN